jgi:hypothetical protein
MITAYEKEFGVTANQLRNEVTRIMKEKKVILQSNLEL